MKLNTDLQGRLRNTSLPKNNGMLPLYEAVSNSIHAIEDASISPDNRNIVIQIIRDGQTAIDSDNTSDANGEIIGFKVIDNGIGFDEDNMKSFMTLDSDYKVNRGGRGVGRLLWLKAFKHVKVDSIFLASGHVKTRRSFTFDARQGVFNESQTNAGKSSLKTTVYLEGFSEDYRAKSPKTAKVIAKNLFEHCLWYFVRDGGAPLIKIKDGNETILLDDIYEESMVVRATPESIELNKIPFELIHVKLSATSTRSHSIAFCAADRLVTRESIKGKIPGLFGNLCDEAGDFVYECYVSSPLLNERVRSERTGFDIEEEPLALLTDNELSKKEIRQGVLRHAEIFLANYLEEQQKRGKERISIYVEEKAPRYRPLLGRMPEKQLTVDPDISDKDLELVLHENFAKIERKFLSEGHDVMNPGVDESVHDYWVRLQSYLEKLEDFKKSDLANYVTHRRTVLDILKQAIQRDGDGEYAREDFIHDLIMPRGKTSDDVHLDRCNLWLIDERLAFHDFLASDKALKSMPVIDSNETKRPDIFALNVPNTPILVSEKAAPPLTSIVVIELKRPMRDDAAAGERHNPIEQVLGYLKRIREGNVQTKTGRPIPKSDTSPGFCYVICDITPTVKAQCDAFGFTPTSDFAGYFGYNPNYRAYIEVISFDRLVNMAQERNKAFFDKLGFSSQ